MKKNEIIYANNKILGYIKDGVYQTYSQDEKQQLFLKIKKEIISKDFKRKIFSLIIGLLLLVATIIFSVLMLLNVISLGDFQWMNYIFLIALIVLIWIIFYYLFGLIFYNSIKINFHFKSSKINNPNSCITYASSNYSKWVNLYLKDLDQFYLYVDNGKKQEPIGFSLRMPSWKNSPLFNGHLKTNIPYFYFIGKNKKILCLPGMIIYFNGKNSDVFSPEELKCELQNEKYVLSKNTTPLLEFCVNGNFNINFFYFKYEQI